MIVHNFGIVNSSEARIYSATVSWEDRELPDQELIFEIRDEAPEHSAHAEPCADAFLAACFPLAAIHGEARIRIHGQPCPLLIEGLYTAHAWWTSWGGMPFPMPLIETFPRADCGVPAGPRRGVAFLSGGVDGLHMLMQNHPTVDGLFSSQRITVVHDGARYPRFQKVRELAHWPAALGALRVCPGDPGTELNCGVCEKCLRTRLELLAAGVEETPALGPSLTPVELWDERVLGAVADRAITYEDLLSPLRARGLRELCKVLEEKIQAYRGRARACENFLVA